MIKLIDRLINTEQTKNIISTTNKNAEQWLNNSVAQLLSNRFQFACSTKTTSPLYSFKHTQLMTKKNNKNYYFHFLQILNSSTVPFMAVFQWRTSCIVFMNDTTLQLVTECVIIITEVYGISLVLYSYWAHITLTTASRQLSIDVIFERNTSPRNIPQIYYLLSTFTCHCTK